jgi:CRP-like cAMP-binding protein
MDHSQIESISAMMRDRNCEVGDQISDPHGDRVFLLKSGRLRLYQLTADGHEVTTSIVEPGHLFGVQGLLGQGHSTRAEALTPAVVCDASAPQLLAILARHPVLMARVTLTLARQMVRMEQLIEEMGATRVPQRVERMLLSLAEEALTQTGEPLIQCNQTEIAKMVGTTRESVARTVGRLRSAGILSPRGLRVLDLDRLRAEAAGDGGTR